jgi:GR25 family glycosyltransferase involved in LPS biosynthesis
MDVFVINLDSKRAAFHTLSAKLASIPGLGPVTRFSAVNGVGKDVSTMLRDVKSNELKDEKQGERVLSLFACQAIAMQQRRYHMQMTTTGAIGCYLSHYLLWKKAVELGRPILVLEDDVNGVDRGLGLELSHVKTAMERGDADMVCFEYSNFYSTDPGDSVTLPSGTKMYRLVRPFWGTMSYAICPRGAKALMETAFPIEVQVDGYVSMRANPDRCKALGLTPFKLYGAKHTKSGGLFVSRSLATSAPSSIQRYNDCPLCEYPAETAPTAVPPDASRFGSTMSLETHEYTTTCSSSSLPIVAVSIVAIVVVISALVILLRRRSAN